MSGSAQVVTDGVEKVFELNLDLKNPSQYEDIMLVEGDTKNQFIIHLSDGGEPVDLTGCKVMLVFSHGEGTTYQDSDAKSGNVKIEGNTVSCRLKTGSFSEGLVECELKIYSGVSFGQTTSSRFNFMCRKSILDEHSAEAEMRDSPFAGIIEQARDAVQKAEKAIVDANLALEAAGVVGDVDMKVYLHIRYADKDPIMFADAKISTKPNDYIGLCVTDSPTAPENPARYEWYRWRGEPGKDGVSNYVYIRYAPKDPAANNITPQEKPSRYMGVCVTPDKIAPTDPDQYEWYLIEGEVGKRGEDGKSVVGVESKNGNIIFKMSDESELRVPTSTFTNGIPPASQTTSGVMTPEDKTKLDEMKAFAAIAISDSQSGAMLSAQNSEDTAIIQLGDNMSLQTTGNGVAVNAKIPDEATETSPGLMSGYDKIVVDCLRNFLFNWGGDHLGGIIDGGANIERGITSYLADSGLILTEDDKSKLEGLNGLKYYSGVAVSDKMKGFAWSADKDSDTLIVSLGENLEVMRPDKNTVEINVNMPTESDGTKAGLMPPRDRKIMSEIESNMDSTGEQTFMGFLNNYASGGTARDATPEHAGLMSAADKAKLDGLKGYSSLYIEDAQREVTLDAKSDSDTLSIFLGEPFSVFKEGDGVLVDVPIAEEIVTFVRKYDSGSKKFETALKNYIKQCQ